MAIYISPEERRRLQDPHTLRVQDMERVHKKINQLDNLRRMLLSEKEQSPERKGELEQEIKKIEKTKELFADQLARSYWKIIGRWWHIDTIEDEQLVKISRNSEENNP